jgi:hypothetical protein
MLSNVIAPGLSGLKLISNLQNIKTIKLLIFLFLVLQKNFYLTINTSIFFWPIQLLSSCSISIDGTLLPLSNCTAQAPVLHPAIKAFLTLSSFNILICLYSTRNPPTNASPAPVVSTIYIMVLQQYSNRFHC